MQKWFFLEDPENAILRGAGDEQQTEKGSFASLPRHYPPRKWLFRIRAGDLQKDETVCVIGSVPELGSWQTDKCVPLDREGESDIWSKVISIPDKESVQYRYCVCVIVDVGVHVIVRNWEVHLEARLITSDAKSPSQKVEPEVYGDIDGKIAVDRGWLNKETVIQLQFLKESLILWKPKYATRTVFVKVTPVNLLRHSTNIPKTMAEALEESLSADTQDAMELPLHAFTEVASLNSPESYFCPQTQFGSNIKGQEMLIFQNTILFPSNTAFLIDLFVYSSRAVEGDPPYHAGFSYLLPSALQSSEGTIILPVTSTKHRPLGEINLRYIVIRPLSHVKCDMSLSYTRHWKKTRYSLDVGHRGCGSSFKIDLKNCAEVRENTIASLKTAIDHGADYVEFDVQLSKDNIPIIYHDFYVCISMKRKKELIENDMLELPVKELTLEQLHLLKVYHVNEGKYKTPRFFDEDLEDHQPFPTLQHVMEVLEPHVGFNIEIKWSMQYKDGTCDLFNPIDLNIYLDTILDAVMKNGRQRRIVFSCFSPDICVMLRLKQNKYPVMFLTQGQTEKYPHYSDPRCWTIESATRFALMMELLGIVVHTEDILKDASLIKVAQNSNLIVFCWGDENADPANIKYLKELGLHGVIYDKINQNQAKESIFLVEARESQKELIRLAASNLEQPAPSPQSPQPGVKERVVDVERVRQSLDPISTATSLASLETGKDTPMECDNCGCRD